MVVATGFFDGVHLGHRSVIETLLQTARRRSEQSLVLTFWPHPHAVLQKGARELRLLTTLDEKRALLGAMGVDRVEVLPFSRDFAAMSAERYLREVVIGRYSGTAIVLGYDNRIGSDALGPDEVAALAASMGLEVIRPDLVRDGTDPVSSTRIRCAVAAGDVAGAARMLGYRYRLHGVVVGGNRIGRTIGFPTANVKLYEPLKLLPGVGAYVTAVEVSDRRMGAMTNIDPQGKIEAHIFGFCEDIYGLDIRVEFLELLRGEKHFESLDALKAQLALDEEACEKRLLLNPKFVKGQE